MIRKVENRISDFMSDGAGVVNANGDYATTPTTFIFGPPEGEIWIVERMIIHIGDLGGAYSASEYGNLGIALPNGYNIEVRNTDDELLACLNGCKPFTNNGNVGAVCYDVANIGAGAGGADAINIRWTFAKAGSPLRLIGDEMQEIRILFTDDLSGLTEHTFFVDGYREEP